MSEGSRRQLIYVAEVTPGTTPGTPACKTLRGNGGAGIRLARQSLVSGEFRQDRAIPSMRLTNKAPSLDIPFEFSYGSFDDFLESALFGAWAAAYALTGLTVDVDATGKTFTRSAGSWVTDGVKVGDKITFGGFAAAGNNGTFVVSAVTDLVVTCATATGLVDVTDDTDVTATTDRHILKQGVTKKFFSIEEGFTDIAQYQVMAGAIVNAFGLEIRPNAIVSGSFGLLGLAAGALAGTSIDASPDAAPTTSPFDSYTGTLKEGGVAIAIVTGLSINVANGLEHFFALFDDDPYKIGTGRANITGRLSAYFEDATLANKFLAETESSIELELEDPDGNKYTVLIPRIKYTGADRSMSENNVAIDLPFQALYDSTTATAIQITRKPA